jgi:hypothetical protein
VVDLRGVVDVLTRDEREQVELAFATALSGQMNPKALVQVVFKAEADPILLDLPTAAVGHNEVASFIVEACLVSRWTHEPALLDLLLDYLITSRGIGVLQAVLLRVRQHIDPNPSVYNSTWVIGERPFFDRGDLRRRVQTLVEQNGRPILRVSAVPESFGRTYSRYYFEYIEDRSPSAFHVLSAELSAGTGPSYQVVDLLETIGAQLGIQQPIPPRADSSYPTSAARWMLWRIMGQPGRWLILLDGFGQNGLNTEVRETIEALAKMVPSGQYRRHVRLVLLDYPHPLPGVTPADVLDEVLMPAAELAREDLTPCLVDWDAERKRKGIDGLADGELVKLVDGMLARAPAAGKERLETLNAALSKLSVKG